MFSHQELFLAVTISLASIALAGVVVQPAYEDQYDSNPRYLQHHSVSHWIQSPIEQYRAEQLPDQESTQYLPGVETKQNEDPKEARRKRLEEYGLNMDFIRHMDGGRSLQPLMVHNCRKRSDPTSTESSKSEIIAHDNYVAARSSLTDAKHPITIDSLLQENKPTDTTDKRVEKLEVEDFITSVLPRLLLSKLHPNIANAMRYAYPYLTAQVGNITVFQAMVNTYAHLLGVYSYPDPTIFDAANRIILQYVSEIINAIMTGWAEPSQNETLQKPTVKPFINPYAGGRASDAHNKMHMFEQYSTAQDEEITNMNMISTAEPSQDKTLQIPFYSEMTPEAYQHPIVGTPYFDTTGTPSPNYYFYYSYNHPNYYLNHDSGNGDFYTNLKRNSNSADNSNIPENWLHYPKTTDNNK